MVMEASPSPQSVGREFVRQYYTLLNKAPEFLHRFYSNYSLFVHGGLDAPNRETLPVVGQKQIHTRIQQLNFRDCHAKISQVDSQATLGNGVVVQVTGELSNGGAPMRRFTQTFVLAAQSPKKYYVHNDIFRYQDVVFPDDDGDASGRSDAEEDEAAGYFPPPTPAFSAPFPAPPAPPTATVPPPHAHAHAAPEPTSPADPPEPAVADPPAPAPAAPPAAPPALNGHPADPPPAVALAPASDEPEPEPPAPASPPPPAAAPEPITYATLLKSAPGAPAAPRAPPPTVAPATERVPRAPAAPAAAAAERRYSDAQQLFLGNLPHGAPEEELRALFARFGPVAELRVHSKAAPPGAPRHPNYGFITYETHQAAQDCLKAAPLFFPAEGEGAGVKLNVEEKKTRGREPPRRRPTSSQRPAFRQPYRR